MDNHLFNKIRQINGLSSEELQFVSNMPEPARIKKLMEVSRESSETHLPFSGQIIQGLDYKIINEYPDVPREHWGYEFIIWANNEGIIYGYPDGFFRPEKAINQGEFLAVLHRYKKISLRTYFLKEHWTEPYYEQAKRANWIYEKHMNLIERSLPISFQEAASIICNSYGHSTLEDAYQHLKDLGVLKQYQRQQNISRAQLVSVFYNLSQTDAYKREG